MSDEMCLVRKHHMFVRSAGPQIKLLNIRTGKRRELGELDEQRVGTSSVAAEIRYTCLLESGYLCFLESFFLSFC